MVSSANSQGLNSCLCCARGQEKEREWDVLPPACWDETLKIGKTSFTCHKGCSKCDLVKSSLLPKTLIHLQNLTCHLYSKPYLDAPAAGMSLLFSGWYTRWSSEYNQGHSAVAMMGAVFFSWLLRNFISSFCGLGEIIFSWLLSFWKAAGVFSVCNSLG